MKHPQHPEGRTVIPCHGGKSIAKGTLGRILKDAGLTGDHLREIL
jgi:predicted RNA binding protein YcfA (HicA-like mRNA interferase family)